MKLSSVRIEMDYDGVAELLRSADVQADLNRRAEAVAESARNRGIMVDGKPGAEPLPIATTEAGSRKRARATVAIDHPSGMAVEAKHRLLVGSLDAARNA